MITVFFSRLNQVSVTRLTFLTCILGMSGIGQAQAAHVPAERLLPRRTLAYLHVPNVHDLVDAFQQTNFGRMINDPQIQPFVSGLFEAANNALVQVREATGLSLEELAKIPSGEITLALLPTSGENSDAIGFVGMADCGDNIDAARSFRENLQKALLIKGGKTREETIEGIAIAIYERRDGDRSPLVSLERDNTLVFCSNLEVAKQLLLRWTDGAEDCLAQNRKFSTIMNRCRGTKDEPPQITFFVDPILIFTELAKNNPAAQLGLAIVPTLGLDGLKGVGGSMVLASEDFDGILQLHVMLGVPRAGIVDLIALESGDDTPPSWIPADVASYASYHWNVRYTFFTGTKLADSFQGDGATAKMLNDRAHDLLGIDLEHEIIPAITGRFIYVGWFQRPVKVGIGQQNLVGIQLQDAQGFAPAMNTIIEHFGQRLERKSFSGTSYYMQAGERDPDDVRPSPCFAILDNWLLVSDRPAILEHILSSREETTNNLANSLEYRLVASKISHQPGGKQPAMLSFTRGEESWRYLYDLAASEDARTKLRDQSERSTFFKTLNQGLESNPIPPWEAISRYLAPEGSMVTDDDSGIHFMQFALRRK
ncbi:MAG TPA: hypothetical protein VGJ04_03650 [Pirellulales bacterium]